MSVSEIGPNLPLGALSPAGSAVPRQQASKETVDKVAPPAASAESQPRDDREAGDDSGRTLEKAINDRINRLLLTDVRIRIDKDHDTGHFVYKSINSKTGELHRQFPAEQILKMLAFFKELDGLLYDEQA